VRVEDLDKRVCRREATKRRSTMIWLTCYIKSSLTTSGSPDNPAMATAPRLAGVHHLKLPVSDLERSRRWYESRLGYRVAIEFVEDGVLMGVALAHPNGGPLLALRLDPQRAVSAAGFDYFAIGVPDKPTLDELAARLTELGDPHGGVHEASAGWILPLVHDPDGHEVRFYTVDQGTISEQGDVLTVHDSK
jgi:catechol 2,3-dioxygenase-like lactoylglutathione lyase family enzyme